MGENLKDNLHILTGKSERLAKLASELKTGVAKDILDPGGQNILNITPNNVLGYKELIKEWLHLGPELDNFPNDLLVYSQMINSVEMVTKRGVKVFAAAGNMSKHFLNAISLADGVITVGGINANALDLDFSGTNTLADEKDLAQYPFYPVFKNGKLSNVHFGNPHISVSVEGQDDKLLDKFPVDEFTGKPARNSLVTPEERKKILEVKQNCSSPCKGDFRAAVPRLNELLFDVGLFVELKNLTGVQAEILERQGQYCNWDEDLFFNIEDGIVTYSPNGRSCTGAKGRIQGTSYAAPTIAGKYAKNLASEM